MGTYLNPGNAGFAGIFDENYVDKSGMIDLFNQTIETSHRLICVSRPRRFGKSFAAQMLSAYYDKTCDSHPLFCKLNIAKCKSYETHINKYDVLYLDMTGVNPYTEDYNKLVPFLIRTLTEELKSAYPDVQAGEDFSTTLLNTVGVTGNKFIAIIDEWDAPIREAQDRPAVQAEYLKFLRALFKNSGITNRVFAAAYMTGILPIKKDGAQSAISDFEEYTVVKPRIYGEYVGFTEKEVQDLCEKRQVSFSSMKQWYDGYTFKGIGSVYNPNSVMKALIYHDFDSYWTETSAASGLMEYISKDYTGLSKTIAALIGGVEVKVNTSGFANDLSTFKSRDDVLTLLIHLGYLAYDSEKKTAHIPNEEIRLECSKAVREVHHAATTKRLRESEQLIDDTVHLRADAVAAQIEKVHSEETVPLHYNNEQSLRSTIKLAYYAYRDHYVQFEELPGGEGYADIVYLPKRDSSYPILVIELKWNQSAKGAIEQIRNRNYPAPLAEYGSRILLVGISYDKNIAYGARKHTCVIEEFNLSEQLPPAPASVNADLMTEEEFPSKLERGVEAARKGEVRRAAETVAEHRANR